MDKPNPCQSEEQLLMRGCLQRSGELSTFETETHVSGKLGLQLADVVGIQTALEQLVRLESVPRHSSWSSASSSSDATSDHPLPQQQAASERWKKPWKGSTTVAVVNPGRYKTELCRQFEEHGSCRYGDKCQFAHGAAELRRLARHPKYKTEMCRTFHTTGFCPYGLRCHFIHNDDDERRAAVLDATAFRRHDAPVSPPSLPGPTADRFPPGRPQSRPVFGSSSSVTAPEAEQRGRPILARGSTLPERSSSTYRHVDQHVSFPSVGRDGDLTTAVRALCA